MRGQLLLTKEQCKEAVQMRWDGKHVADIANHFYVGEATVVRYIRYHGLYEQWREAIRGTNRFPRTGNKKEIPFFYLYHLRVEQGRTYDWIAKDFGCSVRKVQNALERYGIQS